MLAHTPHSKGSCGLKHTVLLIRQTRGLCAVQWRVLHLPAPQHVEAFCRCSDVEWLEICLCLSIPSKHGLPAGAAGSFAHLASLLRIWLHFCASEYFLCRTRWYSA